MIALAALSVSCADNAILEIELDLPANTSGSPTYAFVQTRSADTIDFSVGWGGSDAPDGFLHAEPTHPAAIAFVESGGDESASLWWRSPIPPGRGLGFSGAARVAGAVAAGRTQHEAFVAAATLERHADNAAASAVGGLVAAARVRGGVHVVRLPLDVSLAFVVMVPDVTLSTARARQALPAEVTRENAVFNLSRMALLLAGLADSRKLIPEAAEDRLHQDYRSPLFPAAPKMLAAMVAGGALASCWSGAGPSLMAICAGIDAAQVVLATEAAMAECGLTGQVLHLHADHDGLIVDRDGSAGLYNDD